MVLFRVQVLAIRMDIKINKGSSVFYEVMRRFGAKCWNETVLPLENYPENAKHRECLRETDLVIAQEKELTRANVSGAIGTRLVIPIVGAICSRLSSSMSAGQSNFFAMTIAAFGGFFLSGIFLHGARWFHLERIRTFYENDDLKSAKRLEQRGCLWGKSSK